MSIRERKKGQGEEILKRYVSTQKNFEEKVKLQPEKKKERQLQRREKTLKGKGIGLEIHLKWIFNIGKGKKFTESEIKRERKHQKAQPLPKKFTVSKLHKIFR